MRLCLLVLLLIPTAAGAQTQALEIGTRATLPSAGAAMAPVDTSPDQQATPPAAIKDGIRIQSKNEAYNLTRAGEGRLGVRLGNDMSYRIGGN